MVFKTIASDISKSGQSLTIFGKEARNIYRDFVSAINGIKTRSGGISQFSIGRIFGDKLSKQDIQSIKNYNEVLKNGITYIDKNRESVTKCVSANTAFYRCLGNSSAAAQKLARDANGAAVSEEAITAATNRLTIAQKASTIASKAFGIALKTALNIGFAFAINAIISGITYLVNKQEELKQKHEEEIQKSKELIETFKEEHTTLETIINKYSELSKKTGLTADEKATLLDYQKQLVDYYLY